MSDTNELPIITIHTDGSCKPNPGEGGWGAIIEYKGVEREISGYHQNSTNNRMEITSVIEALKLFPRPCKIHLFTDSQYVLKGITDWYPNWIEKGKSFKNEDLWHELAKLNDFHEVKWKWVKGHSTNEGNIRADKLASQAVKKHRKKKK